MKVSRRKSYRDIIAGINTIKDVEVLIDSGAFSAWNSGREIILEEYCDVCYEYKSKGWQYFQLDVIGNQKKTFDNYEYMISKGLNPIPVFTRGANLKDLRHIRDAKLIGLGSGVKTKGQHAYVKWFLTQEKDVDNRQIHLLGYNNLKTVFTNRVNSVDSTSWDYNARANVHHFFDEKKLRFYDAKLKSKNDIAKLIRIHPEVIKQNMGQDVNLLLEYNMSGSKTEWQKKRFEIAAMAYLKYAKSLFKINGVKYFFAASTNEYANEQLINVYNRRKDLQ